MEEKVIWAFAGKNAKALVHAFVSQSAYERGETLCARTVKPSAEVPGWDLDNKEMFDNTCPYCRERLKLLRLARNVTKKE